MTQPAVFASLLAIVVAIVGWLVAHWLTSKRDLANERRKLKVTYLIEAYRKLEAASNTNDIFSNKQLESAIADIQLLGTIRQVLLAKEFSESIAEKNQGSLNELLFDLRQTLRLELQLDPIKEPISYLRFHKTQ
ncbi:MAG: hypothetical protein AB9872_13460 [Solidesulfovibrio sp.]